jgi:hypothetical protein
VKIEAIEPAVLVKHRKQRTARCQISEGTDKAPYFYQASIGFHAESDAQGQQNGN